MEPQHYIGRNAMIRNSGSVRQYKVVALMPDGNVCLADTNDSRILTERNGIKGFPVERLELVPVKDPVRAAGYVSGSAITVSPDEAVEWLAFVMLQAASLFERVPEPAADAAIRLDDGNARAGMLLDESRNELERLLTIHDRTRDGPVVTAALAYYDAAFAWYQADKAKYDD